MGSPAGHHTRLRHAWLLVLVLSVIAVFAGSRLESEFEAENTSLPAREKEQDQKGWPDTPLDLQMKTVCPF